MSAQASQLVNFSPSTIFDVIGIYDQDFKQVFRQARPLKVSIKPTLSTMEHPMESGSPFADHVVYKPIEAELGLILKTTFDYEDTYSSITQYFNNAIKLSVKTKAAIFSNMIITELPHEENSDYYDSLLINLKLKEVIIVNSESIIAPANPNRASTIKKGIVESKEAEPAQTTKSSAAYRIFF